MCILINTNVGGGGGAHEDAHPLVAKRRVACSHVKAAPMAASFLLFHLRQARLIVSKAPLSLSNPALVP